MQKIWLQIKKFLLAVLKIHATHYRERENLFAKYQ